MTSRGCKILRLAIFIWGISFTGLFAQISPGELSAPHAQLEGISNCTQCHSLGKAIASNNCLKCHKEIQSQIQSNSGFHAISRNKECIECHKEHHGKEFSLIHLDKKTFDHNAIGFALLGKHWELDCLKCHTKEKISQKEILAKPESFRSRTFLGLSKECLTCHKDNHGGQFSSTCTTCHGFDGWKILPGFSHDKTRFPLTGKHNQVACQKCHHQTLPDGKTIQYGNMEFSACSKCHNDPHVGKFRQACESCHITSGWKERASKTFDHSLAGFTLRGKHITVACEQCHGKRMGKKTASFRITKYQLCSDCHSDAHAGQFKNRSDKGKCESCHNEEGYIPSTFSVNDHQTLRFSLTGAHMATPCISCHKPDAASKRIYKVFHWEKDLKCQTCHRDIHQGQFKEKMTKGCETCHTTSAWNQLTFSHNKTKFPLAGKHAEITCVRCHYIMNTGTSAEHVQYTGLQVRCSSCHNEVHEKQFEISGKTDCERCHTSFGWKTLIFQHRKHSRFELTGKHLSVECTKCHLTVETNGKRFIRYKPMELKCVSCHPNQ